LSINDLGGAEIANSITDRVLITLVEYESAIVGSVRAFVCIPVALLPFFVLGGFRSRDLGTGIAVINELWFGSW